MQETLPATYAWSVDGTEVAATREYTFVRTERGTPYAALRRNERGRHRARGVRRARMQRGGAALRLGIRPHGVRVTTGRTLTVRPVSLRNEAGAEFVWTLDGTRGAARHAERICVPRRRRARNPHARSSHEQGRPEPPAAVRDHGASAESGVPARHVRKPRGLQCRLRVPARSGTVRAVRLLRRHDGGGLRPCAENTRRPPRRVSRWELSAARSSWASTTASTVRRATSWPYRATPSRGRASRASCGSCRTRTATASRTTRGTN